MRRAQVILGDTLGLRDGRKVGALPLLALRAKGKRRLFLGSEGFIPPTVTIGGEKCVTERERQKLDATVTVGGQPETKRSRRELRERKKGAEGDGESEKRQEEAKRALEGIRGSREDEKGRKREKKGLGGAPGTEKEGKVGEWKGKESARGIGRKG